MFRVQEIPPGSRSGKLKHQGNMVVFFLAGTGYTILDDKRFDWEAGDCMVFPVKGKGVIIQHFNGDRNLPARFLAAEPNLVDALGVDMGSGFEQLEAAPEE
jgi:gentisate 1,2-dioxygenase